MQVDQFSSPPLRFMKRFMPFNKILFFFKKKIEGNEGVHKVIVNTSWLTGERVLRLFVGLLISIFVARHLGPEYFGMLSYATSIISFLGTFVYLGLSGLVVREIVLYPDEKNLLLGTTFSIKIIGGFFAYIIIILFAFFLHSCADKEFWVLLVMGLGLLARPFETIDYWFQSKVQARYSVVAKSIAFLVASVGKVLLVVLGFSVVGLSVATTVEIILASAILVYIYKHIGHSIGHWSASVKKAKDLLSKSWIILLSGFLAMLNLKVDQVMLRWLSGAEEVGIYGVAVTFSEVWYFIPEFVVVSMYPSLINLRKLSIKLYDKKIQEIFDFLFIISFFVAAVISFIAGIFIPFLYGDEFFGASQILVIHIWAGVFMFLRSLFSKWVLIEDALFYSLFSHGFGALINILLNLFLVPSFGGQGAAVATLLSYACSSYIFLFFFLKTRPLAVKMTKSFLLPARIVLTRGRIWE
jgi:O-antigen/teichoic acid export membrane protein